MERILSGGDVQMRKPMRALHKICPPLVALSCASGIALPTTGLAAALAFREPILPANVSFDSAKLEALKLPARNELEEIMADGVLVAQARTSQRGRAARSAAPVRRRSAPSRSSSRSDQALARARNLAASGQYEEASKLLFQLSRSPQYRSESAQIKYILGLMLYEMKLYQSAAFVFYDVVRQESRSNPKSRYLRQSLEKIALAADQLNSDVLLRYAIKNIREDEFPRANRDMLHYRTGEIRMQEKDFSGAAREFLRVRQGSQFYHRARYRLGLALAEAGALDRAIAVFEDLASSTSSLGVTNPTRVTALMGRARVLYQKHDFAGAIEAYREIPRDTPQWHDALFESSWAMLRDGRFRSALSNFHSLHSSYYEDFYQPESLFLRAIVYLYICRYDEMEKVVDLFERIYQPVQKDVKFILESVSDPMVLYREISQIHENFDKIKAMDKSGRRQFKIPFLVARQILKEGDVRRTFEYLGHLNEEKARLASMSSSWRASGVGQYVRQILDRRIQATQKFAGRQVRHHLTVISDELKDLFEQTGFLRFEMLSGKKEVIRKEIAGKGLQRERVDQDTNRNFYVQNGYEYWPFTGEYWLDEIGNYHYVGVKACE